MDYRILSSCILFIFLLSECSALHCYNCSTLHGDNCNPTELVSTPCEPEQDVCLKVVTYIEQPNSGPKDRMKDNDEKEWISRSCGTKASFVHFTPVDKRRCDESSIGGGGSQVRCMCSGNECNTSSSLQITGIVFSLCAVVTALLY